MMLQRALGALMTVVISEKKVEVVHILFRDKPSLHNKWISFSRCM